MSPTVLHGTVAWALTQQMEKKLLATWRRMLRYVFRLHRRSGTLGCEEWADYMKRSASQVGVLAEKYDMDDWLSAHRRRKYEYAGKVMKQTDGRWTQRAIEWLPNHGLGRSRGRPTTRWSDDLEHFAGGNWPQLAKNDAEWLAASDGFVRMRK